LTALPPQLSQLQPTQQLLALTGAESWQPYLGQISPTSTSQFTSSLVAMFFLSKFGVPSNAGNGKRRNASW